MYLLSAAGVAPLSPRATTSPVQSTTEANRPRWDVKGRQRTLWIFSKPLTSGLYVGLTHLAPLRLDDDSGDSVLKTRHWSRWLEAWLVHSCLEHRCLALVAAGVRPVSHRSTAATGQADSRLQFVYLPPSLHV